MLSRVLLVLCVVLAPAMAEPTAGAAGPARSGQLIGIHVTGGYHLGLFIVLNGNLEFSGGDAPRMETSKTFMWVNDFSAMATMEGKFSLMFPIASLPHPVSPRGTVVTIKAFQDMYNVTATTAFDLSQLNGLIHADLTPEFIRELVESKR